MLASALRDKSGEVAELPKDLRARRARGEVRCAECHRLKLKCDRKPPCSTCTRRGCASICPNGSLKSGSGTRLVLADTEELHKKLAEMSARIRSLEDALQLLQSSQHPGTTHLLLQSHLLAIKNTISRDASTRVDEQEQSTPAEDDDGLTHAFGGLAIAPDGAAQYFGRSAGTQMIFMRAMEKAEQEAGDDDRLDPETLFFDNFAFPRELGVAQPESETFAVLKSCLPSYDRAWTLCEAYLNSGAYYFRPLSREDLLDFVFAPVYAASPSNPDLAMSPATIHPHHLGLVFFICAVGALYDVDLPLRSPEAERYFRLAKAVTSLKPILGEETTFETVMAMAFMTIYHTLGEKSRTQNATHTLMTVTCLLAQNLGLHRDPARWGLSGRVADMRRRAFWELNTLDYMLSTLTACPVFFALRNVDCEPPIDKDSDFNPDGTVRMGYWAWKIHLVKTVLAIVFPATTAVKLPRHQSIMALDTKIRTIVLPPNLLPYINPDNEDVTDSPDVRMQRLKLRCAEADAIIYLHRTYFIQCVLNHPTDPERSPYAASYKATYDSAVTLVQAVTKEAEGHMHYLIRLRLIWIHTYSAATIIGTAIARGPNQPFASSGLVLFANVLGIFEQVSDSWSCARIALRCLTALLGQAHTAYSNYLATGQTPAQEDDENLEIFGGLTHVFRRGGRINSSQPISDPRPETQPQPEDVSAIPPHPPQSQTDHGLVPFLAPWQSFSTDDQNVSALPPAMIGDQLHQFGPSSELIRPGCPLLDNASAAQYGMEELAWNTYPPQTERYSPPLYDQGLEDAGLFNPPCGHPPQVGNNQPVLTDESWESFVRSMGLSPNISSGYQKQ